MNPVKFFISLLALSFLVGCATPQRPESRSEWEAIHKKRIPGFTEEEVLTAAENVFKLADSDFMFEYPPGMLITRRNWLVYAVLAAANGQDFWKVEVSEEPDGVAVLVRATRSANAVTPSPVAGLNSGGLSGVSAQSSALPGSEIYWSGPYRLFWSRLDYMLGRTETWLTCEDAIAQYPEEFFRSDTGVLCGVTVDDNSPKSLAKPNGEKSKS